MAFGGPDDHRAAELRAAVRNRITAFLEKEDPGPVLAEPAVTEADELWDASEAPDQTIPLGVLYLVAMLHWCRYLARPTGAGGEDLEQATDLFAGLLLANADLVPQRVRYAFDIEGRRGTGEFALIDRAVAVVRIAQELFDPVSLSLAIAVLRQAIPVLAADHPRRVGLMSNLGLGLHTRFDQGGGPGDLDEAERWLRAAMESGPPTHPHRATVLSNLANVLHDRFAATGDPADMRKAIEAARASVAATGSDDPLTPARLANLGLALQTRFERTGELADLSGAVVTLQTAADRSGPDHEHRAAIGSSLSGALWLRFQQTEDRADLEEAIAGWRVAADNAGSEQSRAAYLSNVASGCQARFRLTGERTDIDEAVDLGLTVLAATSPDHPSRARYLANQANAFRLRFDRFAVESDLEEAVQTAQAAVDATQPGHPGLAGRLFNLGIALRAYYEAHDETASLDRAISHWRQATRLAATPTSALSLAGNAWGDAAASAGRWGSAAEGYSTVVTQLPTLAWLGVGRQSRERSLAYWSHVATDASACAVAEGRMTRAVELLELGRGVLWSQLIDARTESAELRAVRPDLVDRLRAVRGELDRAES